MMVSFVNTIPMKPLLIASLLVLSSASVALAQCRNGWCQAACDNDGRCDYVKVLSRNYPNVIFLTNTPNGLFKSRGNCKEYTRRYLEINGKPFDDMWKKMMPGSIGEAVLKTACNMR